MSAVSMHACRTSCVAMYAGASDSHSIDTAKQGCCWTDYPLERPANGKCRRAVSRFPYLLIPYHPADQEVQPGETCLSWAAAGLERQQHSPDQLTHWQLLGEHSFWHAPGSGQLPVGAQLRVHLPKGNVLVPGGDCAGNAAQPGLQLPRNSSGLCHLQTRSSLVESTMEELKVLSPAVDMQCPEAWLVGWHQGRAPSARSPWSGSPASDWGWRCAYPGVGAP